MAAHEDVEHSESGPSQGRGPRESRAPQLSALDIHYFFTELEFPTAAESQDRVQRACTLCIEAYGDEKDDVPKGVPNYFYPMGTGDTNLRRHLRKQHPEEYNLAVSEAQSNDGNDRSAIPPFTEEGFLEHLARFVVASGQSVEIVESPYFRQMLMTLRGSLTDADFPDRDKLREAIRNLSPRSR